MQIKSVEILEIGEIKNVLSRVKDFYRFIDITRRFSIRCSAHIKNLAELINSLVDSEDFLEIKVSSLKFQGFKNHISAQYVNLQNSGRESPTTFITTMVKDLQEEQRRMIRDIEDGQKTANYLKDLLENLVMRVNLSKKSDTAREGSAQKSYSSHCHAYCTKGCIEEHYNGHISPRAPPNNYRHMNSRFSSMEVQKPSSGPIKRKNNQKELDESYSFKVEPAASMPEDYFLGNKVRQQASLQGKHERKYLNNSRLISVPGNRSLNSEHHLIGSTYGEETKENDTLVTSSYGKNTSYTSLLEISVKSSGKKYA